MLNLYKNIPNPIKLLLLGGIFFFSFLGNVHLFDWDEINFAESAREMLLSGNYLTVQIDFKPFWEKPPLFFWLQVLAMKAFGVNEFAARFPNAIVGLITLQVVYQLGKKLYNTTMGWWWAWAFLGSFTPHLYFKTGIIDPTFNLFIFLGLYFVYASGRSVFNAILAGIFIGLAMLTKGPVGLLIVGLTWAVYMGVMWFNKQQVRVPFKSYGLIFFAMILTASIWFGLEFAQHGTWFFEQFIAYQIRLFSTPDAGHAQPFYYHFLVVLLGCFPISVFAIRPLWQTTQNAIKGLLPIRKSNQSQIVNPPDTFHILMACLFWVVMILFSIVRTKIVHYSSMAWFPVTFFAAQTLRHLDGKLFSKWLLIAIALLLALVLTAIPLIGMNAFAVMPYIKDEFVVGNLQAPVWWSGWEWLIGIAYTIALLIVIRRNKLTYTLPITAITLWLYSAVVVPKIEGYTQSTAIHFYESFKGQDVYINPLGFKSYAHLFYFDKQPPHNPLSYDENWLRHGKTDKPTYFVCKITDLNQYLTDPQLILIREDSGFAFLKRKTVE
jgi:4-amino-4-deoxy-L-arabinose transferase-like glycosyltransferase